MGKGLLYRGAGGNLYNMLYAELEYIEAISNSYINTNFIPNSNTKIELEFNASEVSGSKTFLFGSGITYNDRNIELYGSGSTNSNLEVHYSDYSNMVFSSTINNKRLKFIQDKNVCSVYENNNLIGNYSFSTKTFTCPYNLYIFALNRGGTPTVTSCSVKMYYFKI